MAYWFLGQSVSGFQVVGMAVVIAALMTQTLTGARRTSPV